MPNIDRLQKLWDAKIITQFYTTPHYNIHRTARLFRQEHSLSDDDFGQLRRIPKVITDRGEFYVNNKDIYGFMAQHLTPLYNVIEPRDVTDLFDILTWLKRNDIATQPFVIERDAQNALQMTRRDGSQINASTNAYYSTFGSKLRRAFFKPTS